MKKKAKEERIPWWGWLLLPFYAWPITLYMIVAIILCLWVWSRHPPQGDGQLPYKPMIHYRLNPNTGELVPVYEP